MNKMFINFIIHILLHLHIHFQLVMKEKKNYKIIETLTPEVMVSQLHQ